MYGKSSVVTTSMSYFEIPITALSKSTRRKLSAMLNEKKMFPSQDGYDRDWRGIVALAKLKSHIDETAASDGDSIAIVLQQWCIHNPKTATLAHLDHFLGIIERWGVLDLISGNFAVDAMNYKVRLNRKTLAQNDEPDAAHIAADINSENYDFGSTRNLNILTKDDVLRAQKGLPSQKYDAYVLYADIDINYVAEMMTRLEDRQDFKFCLKHRDLLDGVSFVHAALTQLIEERCKHLIVIVTHDFMASPENIFLVHYTQALQIQQKTCRIIPLLYDNTVRVPGILKMYTHLKYRSNGLVDFWGTLASSVRNDKIPTEPEDLYSLSATNEVASYLKAIVCTCVRYPHDQHAPRISDHIELKKKQKWPRNIFKKIFSRSTYKLKKRT